MDRTLRADRMERENSDETERSITSISFQNAGTTAYPSAQMDPGQLSVPRTQIALPNPQSSVVFCEERLEMCRQEEWITQRRWQLAAGWFDLAQRRRQLAEGWLEVAQERERQAAGLPDQTTEATRAMWCPRIENESSADATDMRVAILRPSCDMGQDANLLFDTADASATAVEDPNSMNSGSMKRRLDSNLSIAVTEGSGQIGPAIQRKHVQQTPNIIALPVRPFAVRVSRKFATSCRMSVALVDEEACRQSLQEAMIDIPNGSYVMNRPGAIRQNSDLRDFSSSALTELPVFYRLAVGDQIWVETINVHKREWSVHSGSVFHELEKRFHVYGVANCPWQTPHLWYARCPSVQGRDVVCQDTSILPSETKPESGDLVVVSLSLEDHQIGPKALTVQKVKPEDSEAMRLATGPLGNLATPWATYWSVILFNELRAAQSKEAAHEFTNVLVELVETCTACDDFTLSPLHVLMTTQATGEHFHSDDDDFEALENMKKGSSWLLKSYRPGHEKQLLVATPLTVFEYDVQQRDKMWFIGRIYTDHAAHFLNVRQRYPDMVTDLIMSCSDSLWRNISNVLESPDFGRTGSAGRQKIFQRLRGIELSSSEQSADEPTAVPTDYTLTFPGHPDFQASNEQLRCAWAVQQCRGNVVCIFGGPGTGKTALIVAITSKVLSSVKEETGDGKAAWKGAYILVTAVSNTACDRLAEAFASVPEESGVRPVYVTAHHTDTEEEMAAPHITLRNWINQATQSPSAALAPLVKRYHNAKGTLENERRTFRWHKAHREPWRDAFERVVSATRTLEATEQLIGEHLMRQRRVNVVIASCSNSRFDLCNERGRADRSGPYSVVIFDESGQANEPEVLYAASALARRPRCVALVGDTEQLVTESQSTGEAARLYAKTPLQRMWNDLNGGNQD